MKIGIIDYYLDEWHANSYPKMIREQSGGKVEVAYAYGMIANPFNGRTSEEWCEKYGVECCHTMEEVVEKSDVLLVLAPEYPETHEELSIQALKSGKKTYIDKTFAHTKASAEAIFALAKEYGTPCYSSSALRYAVEYEPYKEQKVLAATMVGGSHYKNYSIHMIEPLVILMGKSVKRVMAMCQQEWTTLMLEWEDGRFATMTCTSAWSEFTTNLLLEDKVADLRITSDFFGAFIEELLHFCETGEVRVPWDETIAIIAIREAGEKAMQQPGTWIEV